MANKTKSARLSLRIPEEVKQKLQALADAEEIKLSVYAEAILKKHIKEKAAE
jgi:predicted HicB family RNase H-like nuclease